MALVADTIAFIVAIGTVTSASEAKHNAMAGFAGIVGWWFCDFIFIQIFQRLIQSLHRPLFCLIFNANSTTAN
ncbi:MAG: hypothetical protein IKR52_08270 [Paludibacteraceae bacterium]|nr:hypothetical protein [Paludibacteraceae bacterium]